MIRYDYKDCDIILIQYTVYVEIFTNFAICSHWRNFLSCKFLSCVNDYIEDMATFTALVKIYSTKYFCNTKVAGLGEIFVKRNFSEHSCMVSQAMEFESVGYIDQIITTISDLINMPIKRYYGC